MADEKKDLGSAKDLEVTELGNEDLESVAGGIRAETDPSITECCTVPSTDCCEIEEPQA